MLTRLLNPPARRARAYPNAALYAALSGGLASATASGVAVTPEGSLANTAVLAAVRVLSESVSSLPLFVYERLERGKRRAPEHWLYGLLHDRPNPEQTAMEWRELGMVHLALWGNFYCEVEQSRNGRALALWPLRPDRMEIGRDGGGRLAYRYRVDGGTVDLPASAVLHVRGMGPDGVKGYSLISLARQAVGLGLAAEEFGARFFGNGAVPGLVLQHPGTLDEDAHMRLRKSWESQHQGLENSQRVAILEEGMTVEKIGLPPEDAQFLATRAFQVTEIARMFRIPPHMLGDLEHATFSNIEHQAIDFVVHTLRPWLVRWEQALQGRLLGQERRYFVEHLVDGLLRGDTASRFTAYATARQWGWLSANEIRELENLNPVEGGDVYLQPMNMGAAGEPSLAAGDGDLGNAVRAAFSGSVDQAGAASAREVRAEDEGAGAAANVHRLASTYRRNVETAVQRVVNRETNDVGNAARRLLGKGDVQGFRDWLTTFYREHAKFAVEYLTPTFTTLAELTAPESKADVEGQTRAYLESRMGAWCQEHRAALDEGADEGLEAVEGQLEEWKDGEEAESVGGEQTFTFVNFVSKLALAAAGVKVLRWVSFGENCPYCSQLNGRTVGIEGYFLEPGQSLEAGDQPAFVTKRFIGHPPLHAGCDCMVVGG